MDIYGNPTLQGGAAPIQGSNPTLQGGYNPQQASGLYGPVFTPQPAAKPTVKPVTPVQPVRSAVPVQQAQPIQLNSIFNAHIGTRPSASNPGVLEYYNKSTGQGFATPQDLFNYASQLGAGVVGSFDQLRAPVNGSVNTQVQNYQPAQPADPNQGLAQQAGAAGLSVDEFMKLLQQQNLVTPQQLNQIYQQLGIPDAANSAFAPPSQSTVDFYNQLYGSAGLADVKQKILDLNAKIAKGQQDFLDAQGVLNENPFLSEASRIGRVSRLNDKAQAEINNLLEQQQQYQTLYQNGLGEINNVVSAHTQDFNTNQQLSQAKLTYLLSQVDKQTAAQQNQANQSAYQYLPAYLQAKAKATAPTSITAPNGAVFTYDKATGTYQQLVGPGGDYAQNNITGDLYSQNTGQTLGSGTNYGAGLTFNTGNNNMRTDRNNNPTAFTTAVAKTAGLVEGVDYVQGDSFKGGDGQTYYTAKLLGDPIATTIKAIDKAGFYTASGQPRWSYLSSIPDAKNWANLSYDQKAKVVAQMYQKEGGNGSLVQGSGGGTIDNLVQQVLGNPQVFQTLSPTQQQAVTARMAQQGIPIPPNLSKPSDAQNQSAGFATRIQQSGSVLDKLEQAIASYNPIGFAAQLKLPSAYQSSIIQQYNQAALNFIGAKLRKESGAAISQTEYDNAYAQYLPRAGDSAAVLKQKSKTVTLSSKQKYKMPDPRVAEDFKCQEVTQLQTH